MGESVALASERYLYLRDLYLDQLASLLKLLPAICTVLSHLVDALSSRFQCSKSPGVSFTLPVDAALRTLPEVGDLSLEDVEVLALWQ